MERVEPTDADLRRIEALAGGTEVVSLVEELPADQRRAVRARVVEERGYGEIARELEIFANRRAQAREPWPRRDSGAPQHLGRKMSGFVTRLEAELHRAAIRQENPGALRGVALPRVRLALARARRSGVPDHLVGRSRGRCARPAAVRATAGDLRVQGLRSLGRPAAPPEPRCPG